MRLLDAVFDVLRRAGEPLSPAEIVRQIKSARIPIDANELLDDESVKAELEHVATDGTTVSGSSRHRQDDWLIWRVSVVGRRC